ncbi:AAA family ATPase [Sphingobacterium detergens]|uniref:AAA family ATPase n=1 Tax=Sphingobacterium detergens TaxID=1145106 RepID=UPI003AAED9A1
MEMIIYCGIQASGKSSFYKENHFNSHVRISMDLLNTRNKENKFIKTCLETQQTFVVDNTNPTKAERAKYIDLAKMYKYKIIGYYFSSSLLSSLERNSARINKERIPDIGIRGTHKKLQIPSLDEGFDKLYYVTLDAEGFIIKDWENEV